MSALPCSCCIGLVCPCVLYGQIIERINIGSCCATAALCVVCAPCAGWNGARSRQVMVNKYSGQGVELEFGSFHVELCCWCFCAPCSICQEYRTIMPNVDLNGNWVTPVNFGDTPVLATPTPFQAPTPHPNPTEIHTEVELQGVSLPTAGGGVSGGVTMDSRGPLPSGWTQIGDATGKTVYYNAGTQMSTYDRPAEPAEAALDGGRSCCGAPGLM